MCYGDKLTAAGRGVSSLLAWGRAAHLPRRKKRGLACRGYLVALVCVFEISTCHQLNQTKVFFLAIPLHLGWLPNFDCLGELLIEPVDAQCLVDDFFQTCNKMVTIADMSYNLFKTKHMSLSMNHIIFLMILHNLTYSYFKDDDSFTWEINQFDYQHPRSYQQVVQESDVKALACKCHGNSPVYVSSSYKECLVNATIQERHCELNAHTCTRETLPLGGTRGPFVALVWHVPLQRFFIGLVASVSNIGCIKPVFDTSLNIIMKSSVSLINGRSFIEPSTLQKKKNLLNCLQSTCQLATMQSQAVIVQTEIKSTNIQQKQMFAAINP
ncbi:hypothetical protein VP01_4841g2 [Puccinia sorghi]|uniref:Uncharacterized protein n=1 Tax=Puccinia sorghi TaxID=27349 RepID=A0A0L6UN52_9BASI|nr:hypothetical protein VP01_4841g2 [Puccinia sorghi]